MNSRALTIVLTIALIASALVWAPKAASYRLIGHNQGYEPVQPIAYSHRLHAGELRIACQYCHWAADKSRHAGIPAASICMNCHKAVTSASSAVRAEAERARAENREPKPMVSAEIRKIYEHLGLGEDRERDPDRAMSPIAWTKVYSVPDFVFFDHRAHVGAGVRCQDCHGPVETMERIRQVGTLSMGWCVQCHRDATQNGIAGRTVNAPIECSTCHR